MSIYVNISGTGPDLVLLHGWAMHGGVFAEIVPVLAQHHRVHVIDLPGHGRSNFIQDIATLERMMQHILPHMPPNAIVLGWSLGGQIAMRIAAQKPLRALVLISATPKFVADQSWPHGMAPAVFAQFFARLHQNIESTVQDFLSLQVRGDVHAMHTLKALRAQLLQHAPDSRMLEVCLTMLRDTDLRAQLSALHLPTLLIAGEHDRITHPRATQAMMQLLPEAQYVEIKRAGHASFISHREEFLHALMVYLATLPAGEA
jgi:pimeloyl-[acyl-carrier protein] methyl ester esterase